jgi:2-polyprenyl-6-methoxyphenol hydroxylase-like FAD-dependent oxidoreductase
MRERDVPVLIVGGSLVGLTMSVLLSARGVANMVVERHRGTAIHPRAASFHQRTMEVFREVGLQEEIEAAAAEEFVQNGAIVAVESLCGRELTYFYKSYNDGVEGLSPTSRLFITQVGLEPVIREHAAALGAEHRYGTELVDFEQDADRVHAVVRSRDTGEPELVHARYLVAADGAHSGVRGQLGIPMLGRGSFAHCVTIYFRADVRPMLRGRNLSVVYVNHPRLLGFFRFAISGDSGFLAVFVTSDADGGNRTTDIAADTGTERCAEYVRTALGCGPGVPIEVDDVQTWYAEAGWAERFVADRVLLAGDAAHVMPPTGGFGGNTGIADAHNLAWKLAAVLEGWAGPGLLATYDAERRPAAALTVEQAYTRYVLRVDSTLPREDMAPPLDDAGIELGAVYASAAVVADHADPAAPPLEDPRTPAGRPGTRLPHAPVTWKGAPASLLDVTEGGFALLTGVPAEPWCAAAERAAARLGVPLRAYRIGTYGDLVMDEEVFRRACGVGPDGAVLVRPDGILAWACAGPVDDPTAAVQAALRRVLCRQDGPAPEGRG